MQSQVTAILKHLRQGKAITPLEALELFGCFRLGARIHDIKRIYPELNIKSEMINVGKKRVARYTLEGE